MVVNMESVYIWRGGLRHWENCGDGVIATPDGAFLGPRPKADRLLSRKCAKVRTFLFLPRRVLPSYLTGVTFPTTAGTLPDAAPPLLAGLATGRAVSVASRCIPLCTIYKSS